MKKMLCFDMDGTIADLYGVDDWLKDLMNENPYPYTVAKPLCDIEELNTVLNKLIEQGWEIRVISWLAKDSSNSYKTAVRDAKRTWLAKYNFPLWNMAQQKQIVCGNTLSRELAISF